MRISVIIPALNEETALPTTLASIRCESPHEIIVVDGGSSDRTASIAATLADRVLSGVRGRAAQMNLGAEHASGDALLFIHADCTLESGGLNAAGRLLMNNRIAAGCFQMKVPGRNVLYRSIETCAAARVRVFGIMYGDQGLFVRRETFEKAGRFPQLRLMEDVFLSLKLRRLGRIVMARKRINSSPRRWQNVGIIRQTLRNWSLTALAAAGIHPDRLARFYPTVR